MGDTLSLLPEKTGSSDTCIGGKNGKCNGRYITAATRKTLVAPILVSVKSNGISALGDTLPPLPENTGSSDTCIGGKNGKRAIGDTLPPLPENTGSSDTCIGEKNGKRAIGDTSIAATRKTHHHTCVAQ